MGIEVDIGSTSPKVKVEIGEKPKAGAAAPLYSRGPRGLGDKYDIAVFIQSTPRQGELYPRHVFAAAVSFPADFDGSVASAEIAATNVAVFAIEKNGSPIGTLTFAQGSDTGVFSGSATSFSAGDVLTITAPTPADATLAHVSITLTGSR